MLNLGLPELQVVVEHPDFASWQGLVAVVTVIGTPEGKVHQHPQAPAQGKGFPVKFDLVVIDIHA
jgi:hypothetical protein